jgi:predicted nucleic acid-binding protein
MPVFVDTGILLRFLDRSDPQHQAVRAAVRFLRQRGQHLVTSLQNFAEFWNVCTRPPSQRAGLGLSVEETSRRLRVIERGIRLISESFATSASWKSLVTTLRVTGVKVHDARIVALMQTYGITELLTLNKADFARYPGLTVLTPEQVIRTGAS